MPRPDKVRIGFGLAFIVIGIVLVTGGCKPAPSTAPLPPAYNVRGAESEVTRSAANTPAPTTTAFPEDMMDGAIWVARIERINIYYVRRFGHECFIAIGPQPIAMTCSKDAER